MSDSKQDTRQSLGVWIAILVGLAMAATVIVLVWTTDFIDPGTDKRNVWLPGQIFFTLFVVALVAATGVVIFWHPEDADDSA